MVQRQPIICSVTIHQDGLVVQLRNRPSYGLAWLVRALEGLKVNVTEVLHGNREYFLEPPASEPQDLRVLRDLVSESISSSDEADPEFESPQPRLTTTA